MRSHCAVSFWMDLLLQKKLAEFFARIWRLYQKYACCLLCLDVNFSQFLLALLNFLVLKTGRQRILRWKQFVGLHFEFRTSSRFILYDNFSVTVLMQQLRRKFFKWKEFEIFWKRKRIAHFSVFCFGNYCFAFLLIFSWGIFWSPIIRFSLHGLQGLE